jgi:hypothetical protein
MAFLMNKNEQDFSLQRNDNRPANIGIKNFSSQFAVVSFGAPHFPASSQGKNRTGLRDLATAGRARGRKDKMFI